MLFRILSLYIFVFLNQIDLSRADKTKTVQIKCIDLLVGQYRCLHPKIDDLTQEPQGCERHHFISNGKDKYTDTAPITCYAAPRIICEGGVYNESIDGYVFEKRTACRWTNGKYYRTTLALSLFLGTDWLFFRSKNFINLLFAFFLIRCIRN